MEQRIESNHKLYSINIIKIKMIITKYNLNILKDFIYNINQINLVKLMNHHNK